MHSIRRKLITSILAVIIGVTCLLAVATYYSVREEMDEFYDENIRQVAHAILASHRDHDIIAFNPRDADIKLGGEEEILIQIWRGSELKYSSHSVAFPLQPGNGYGRAEFQGHEWRYYKETEGATVIQLAQSLTERHNVVVELYGYLLLPILLQLPILAGLIWVLIGYGLRPLEHLSNLIRNRHANFLDPLPGDDIPVEIIVLVSALNDLLRRLKEALETQRRFTADAAHELRTPLAAIRLQLDILKRAGTAAERSEAIETLEKGVSRSTRLVQQLLELARQDPHSSAESLVPVDLSKVVAEITDQMRPLAAAKNITLQSHFLAALTLRGNAAKLSVLVENLLHNAILYTPPNGQIDISLGQDGQYIVLVVADTGIGIQAQDRERVFDRFYRVTGNGATGSGLGLSIVRTIADLHNASIEVSDGPGGRGTKFQLVFK